MCTLAKFHAKRPRLPYSVRRADGRTNVSVTCVPCGRAEDDYAPAFLGALSRGQHLGVLWPQAQLATVQVCPCPSVGDLVCPVSMRKSIVNHFGHRLQPSLSKDRISSIHSSITELNICRVQMAPSRPNIHVKNTVQA